MRRPLLSHGNALGKSPIAELARTPDPLVPVVVGAPRATLRAAATEVLSYYRSPETVAAPFRSFVFTVGLVTFVWFVPHDSPCCRGGGGEAPWRSAIAMGSVCSVALVLSWNEIAVAFRAMTSTLRSRGMPSMRDKLPLPTPGWPWAASLCAAAGSSRRPDSCPAGRDGWLSLL